MILFWTVVLSATLSATPIDIEEVRWSAKRNTDALKAQLEVKKLSEQVSISASSLWPQIALEAGASRLLAGPQRTFATVPDPTAPKGFRQQAIDVPGFSRDNFSLGLSVSQLIYDGGRWFSQMAQSRAQVTAQQNQAEEQALASELEAVRRFFELLRAQRALLVMEDLVARSSLQVEKAKALFQAGRAQLRDALDAEVNLGNDNISVLRQKQKIAGAEADLAVWLGRPGTDEMVAIAPGDFQKELPTLHSLESSLTFAEGHRPLLKALQFQLKAAQEAVSVAKSTYLPKVTASGGYSRQSPSADPFFRDGSLQNSIHGGANIQWQLFDGFNTPAKVNQANLQKSATLLAFEQAARELQGEVRRTWVSMKTQLEISKVSGQNLDVARNAMRLAEERFSAGAGSTFEVRDAQLKLAQAELAVMESRIDVEISKAALERVIGGRLEGMNP